MRQSFFRHRAHFFLVAWVLGFLFELPAFQRDALAEGGPDSSLIRIRTSFGAVISSSEHLPQSDVESLDPVTTQTLLKRLPQPEASEVPSHSPPAKPLLPAGTLQPPQADQVVELPVIDLRSEVKIVPVKLPGLSVLRAQPQGKVAAAPHISVTFSEPMVALGSDKSRGVDISQIPVKLTPEVAGLQARWISTRTLMLTAGDHLPMATEYTLEVPSGTRSQAGSVVGKKYITRFSTPEPLLEKSTPEEGAVEVALMAPLLLRFNQRLDPDQLLSHLNLLGGKRRVRLKLAPLPSEFSRSETMIAVMPESPLDPDTRYSLELEKGTRFSEGPIGTSSKILVSFQTLSALKVRRVNYEDRGEVSGDGSRQEWEIARPGRPIIFEFNHVLDESHFREDWVTISPKPDSSPVKITVSGSNLIVSGLLKPATVYHFALSTQIRDVYGQNLAQESSHAVTIQASLPQLLTPESNTILLAHDAKPYFPALVLNQKKIEVEVRAVAPWEYRQFLKWSRDPLDSKAGEILGSLGKRTYTSVMSTSKSEAFELAQIPLESAFLDGFGTACVILRTQVEASESSKRESTVQAFWVHKPKFILEYLSEGHRELVRATHSVDGSPIEGVELVIRPSGKTLKTDQHGIVRVDGLLAQQPTQEGSNASELPYIEARLGSAQDALFLDSIEWRLRARKETSIPMRIWVSSDRPLYRPGESVRVHGWVRTIESVVGASPELSALKKLGWIVKDSRGVVLGQGSTPPSTDSGQFDFEFKLPEGVNLGSARIFLNAGMTTQELSFSTQEFRKPDFEGSVVSDRTQVRLGEDAVFSLSTRFFNGGSVAGLPVRWKLDFNRADYSSSHWPDFEFMTGDSTELGARSHVEDQPNETDPDGKASYRVRFEESTLSSIQDVNVTATVQDLNRQSRAFSSRVRFLPRDRVIGLRVISKTLRPGLKPEVEFIVLNPSSSREDLESKVQVHMELWKVPIRWGWEMRKSSGAGSGELLDSFDSTSKSRPELAGFAKKLTEGGYEIRASGRDSEGRTIESKTQFFVWGPGPLVEGTKDRPPLKLKWEGLDKQGEGRLNQPLKLRVETADESGNGFVVLSSHGRFETREFEIRKGQAEISIVPESVDDIEILAQVDVIPKSGQGIDRASTSVRIARPERTLDISLKPSESRPLPGSTIQVEAWVRDQEAKPVQQADLWIFAVDDALLSLAAHSLENPAFTLWKRESLEKIAIHRREDLVTFDPQELLRRLEDFNQSAPESLMDGGVRTFSKSMANPAPLMVGSMDEVGGGDSKLINLRKDFRSLAFYEGKLRSDSHGHVSFSARLPDSTTRYTLFVVAVDRGGRGATKTFSLQTGLPFQLRASFPRFLNVGDQAELSVLVQNQTEEARSAHVVARAWGLELGEQQGFQVTVPSHEVREIRIAARAGQAGRVLVQLGLTDSKSGLSDAVQQSFPVYLPTTLEAYAQSGSFDSAGISLPVEFPNGVEPELGGIDVHLSTSRVQSLAELAPDLSEYPFDCSEQVASKILGWVALKPILSQFRGRSGFLESESQIASKIRLLEKRIRQDGSFDYWGNSDSGIPYITVHVAHALVRAKAAGVNVPSEMLGRVLGRLRSIRAWAADFKGSEESSDLLEAYALRVRGLAGESVAGGAERLYSDARKRTPDGIGLDSEFLGHLLPVVFKKEPNGQTVAEIRRLLLNRIEETDGRAHLVSAVRDSNRTLLQSDRRSEAVVLEALVESDPKNELLPKLVEGVLAVNSRGLWRASTQENAFVLLALSKYFHVLERKVPSLKARVWLNQTLRLERDFEGRESGLAQAGIPIRDLGSQGTRSTLLIQKQGRGRVYFRVGMKLAPKGMDFLAENHGFEVSRIYEGLDDPRDVRQDENGVWRIKAGARVRIRTRVFTQADREQVALVESFAGGFEPELIEPTRFSQGPWFGWGHWYQHSQLRDQRAEAFASGMDAGEYELVTWVRATGLGRFVAPPSRAEEMYSPDVFGRSRSDQIWIEN